MTGTTIDLHQHLWPAALVDRLRARHQAPFLRDWTLHTTGEPPYDVDPAHHDVSRRAAQDRRDGIDLACVSLSAPLGIEGLPRADADELLGAWHTGARALPSSFAAWASVVDTDPDLGLLADQLRDGFVGVQVAATQVCSPAGWERVGPVLAVAEEAGRPVFVHPGPAASPAAAGAAAAGAAVGTPGWWAPVVDYAAQMQAAWWAWHSVGGRALHPRLRLLLGAGAGLAPLHHERLVARGGDPLALDPDVFVDTSSYGPQALDALVRVLGIDVLALGSDRPYGVPIAHLLGDAATHAVRVTNPHRLLTPTPTHRSEEAP